MTSLKGHFDGSAIILDEPADLTVGQQVRVVVEPSEPAIGFRGYGLWKDWEGKDKLLEILEDKKLDEIVLEHFKDYMP